MNILQTPTFAKKIKKFHENQQLELRNAIKEILENPKIGEPKKGDLAGVLVYKFKMVKTLTLIAYKFNRDELILLAIGTHENFYRDIKN